MMFFSSHGIRSAAILVCAGFALSACGAMQRLSDIGKEPEISGIQNPVNSPGYQPVSMPMPTVEESSHQPNSLWRSGSTSFFRDQRASRIGDILTVNIAIEDKAVVDNSSVRTRDSGEDADLSGFLGFEGELAKVLPNSVSPSSLVSLGSKSTASGKGTINRKETINLVIAAIVTQVLPNGNLVIQGHQEVRVNFEVRDLNVAGVIRPEDISASNTIQHTQIAEARISYGGRGQITDVQQPRLGQQFLDVVLPF